MAQNAFLRKHENRTNAQMTSSLQWFFTNDSTVGTPHSTFISQNKEGTGHSEWKTEIFLKHTYLADVLECENCTFPHTNSGSLCNYEPPRYDSACIK